MIRCPATAAVGANHFALGDQDDRFHGRGLEFIGVSGQGGDDIIRGGRTVSGGSGRDSLTSRDEGSILWGKAGRDRLRGGKGSDELCGDCGSARPARDVIEGGGGVDTVRWVASRTVYVDLADRTP